jgi:hypothetical protein
MVSDNLDDWMMGGSHEYYRCPWSRIGQRHGMRLVTELLGVQFIMAGVRRDLNLHRCREPAVRMELNFCDDA